MTVFGRSAGIDLCKNDIFERSLQLWNTFENDIMFNRSKGIANICYVCRKIIFSKPEDVHVYSVEKHELCIKQGGSSEYRSHNSSMFQPLCYCSPLEKGTKILQVYSYEQEVITSQNSTITGYTEAWVSLWARMQVNNTVTNTKHQQESGVKQGSCFNTRRKRPVITECMYLFIS